MKLCKGMKLLRTVEGALSVRQAMFDWIDHTSHSIKVNNDLTNYLASKQKSNLKTMVRFLNEYT
jgi:hypothetical protein